MKINKKEKDYINPVSSLVTSLMKAEKQYQTATTK